jgi:hypothetical protein
MIDSLPTSLIHCWRRTGSVNLLSKTENAPTSSARLQQKLTHGADVRRRNSKPDAQNHRISKTISGEQSSNPHSSIATAQTQLPRTSGFLP